MIKIWVLVLFMHTPELPSIKYQAQLYVDEFSCIEAQASALTYFNSKAEEYKERTKFDAHCIEFESFTIKKLMGI